MQLIAYASRQAHSSAERAGLLGGVKIRLLDTDDDYRYDTTGFNFYNEIDILPAN